MRWVALVGCTAIACGARSELSGDDTSVVGRLPDAASTPDASPARCDRTQPFGAAIPLDAINTASSEIGITLTSDQLTAVIVRLVLSTSYAEMRWLHRQATNEPFVSGTPISGVFDGDAPNLTDDELTLLAFRVLSPDEGWFTEYHRSQTTDPFTETNFDLIVPSHLWAIEGGLYANRSATTIYYDSFGMGVVRATRTGPLAPFGSATKVPFDFSFDAGTATPGGPVVTADELTIVFAHAPDVSSRVSNIWEATRATTEEPFSNPRLVSELTTDLGEGASWISPDGCDLYFARAIPTDASQPQYDLYFASRTAK